MIAKNGGLLTTIVLRENDATLSAPQKRRYYEFFSKHGFDLSTSTADGEVSFDDHARAAVAWLIEQTRDQKKYPLVFKENISYGFRRNLYGLKAFALVICFFSLLFICAAAWYRYDGSVSAIWLNAIVALAIAAWTFAWLLFVRIDFVEDAAKTYAIRLLAQCDVVAGLTARSSARRKASS